MCDELDGRFARALHQTSSLGLMLDMVTDRYAAQHGECSGLSGSVDKTM